MAYQRPPFRTPFSAFALQNPMPIPGQFFNTGQPLNARPLLQGFGNAAFRLPPQLRPQIPINLQQQQQHHQPQPQQPRPQQLHTQPQQQQQTPTKFRVTSPPKTTVFVGNISEEVETDLLQKMCEECGIVNSFRRLQGANGKPQAFGFCEFNTPDATRRALRLLNAFNLGGKPLLIKVEEKVMNQIHEYLNSLRQDNGLLPLPLGTEFPITDEERDGDIIAKKRIIEMVEAVDKNLLREPDPPQPEPKKEEKKALLSSDSEDDRREKDRDRSRRRKHRSSRDRSPRRHRSRSRSPRRTSRRDRSPRSERSSKKSKKQKHSDAEEDEAKRRERQKRKEREDAYQRRLKKWEDKEVRFAREVEKDREKERHKRKAVEKEAKKLQLFHENYDDDVDDQKYYRGDLLIQRRRMLEQQLELDRKDREAEEVEFEKMKSEILATNPEKLKNIEEEARRRKENEETKMNIKFGIKSTTPLMASNITPDGGEDDNDSRPAQFKVEPQNSGWETVDSPSVSMKVPSMGKKIIKVETARVTANGLFADDDEEEEAKKKKKLQPFIISSEERIAILTPDERKRMIRDLIDKIPKSREQIFAYPMKWEYLDDPMIDTRIRPWIAKKVVLALGEQEPDLTTFICECVKKRSDPKKLVLDLSMVFDEEAESFITKMWRLIIYETEARYKGLSALSSTAGAGPSL